MLRTPNQVMVLPIAKTYENRIGTNARTVWTSNDPLLEYVKKSDAVQGKKSSQDQLVTLVAKKV